MTTHCISNKRVSNAEKTVNSNAAIAQDVAFSDLLGVLGDAGVQKKSPAEERATPPLA
jgi:hypothetical protein